MTTSAKRGQEPYYEADGITLYWGDCTKILPTLTAEAGLEADVCVTDPPYGETSLAWDAWPSGWPALVAEHVTDLWCFGSLRMFTEQWSDFAAWKLAQDIVWEKNVGSSFVTDRFMRVHEYALHFYTGAWGDGQHEVPRVGHRGPDKSVRRAPVPSQHHGDRGVSEYVDNGTRLQRSVIKVANLHGKAIHPTQKPIGILEPLIRYSCPPGGTVLDPFAGGGVNARRRPRSGVQGHRDRSLGGVLRADRCAPCTRRPVRRVSMTTLVKTTNNRRPHEGPAWSLRPRQCRPHRPPLGRKCPRLLAHRDTGMSWTPLAIVQERLDRRAIPPGTVAQEWSLYEWRNHLSNLDYLHRMTREHLWGKP